MRGKFTVLMAVLLAVGLTAPSAFADSHKIVIGHPANISGKYAKSGEQAVTGIKASVKWINDVYGGVTVSGKKMMVEYKVYDAESKKESVSSLLEKLITSDKVNFTVAPYSSGLTLAGATVAEKYGMIYMDHGGASNKIFKQGYEYIVQTIGPASRYHEGTLDMIKKIDPSAKRLALAYEDSEFAQYVMSGTEAYAKKLGFDIVFKRSYPKGVTDLTPLLSDLKASKAELVLGGGHLGDGQLLTKQLSELNINPKVVSLISAASLTAFGEALGATAEGVIGPTHWEYGVTFSKETAEKNGETWIGPSQDEYVALFKAASSSGNLEPDYHGAEASAAILALVLAVENADSLDSDKVRAAHEDLQFTSFYGTWDIDETGMQVGHSMVDTQWQDGKRVIIWPEAAQTGAPAYPKKKF